MTTVMQDRAKSMAEKIGKQLRVRGETLSDVRTRAGRRLPRSMRREAAILDQAAELSAHPKLRAQIDEGRVARAERNLDAFLGTQNPGRERLNAFLDRLAGIAFVLWVVGLAVFFTLLWRGYFAIGSG